MTLEVKISGYEIYVVGYEIYEVYVVLQKKTFLS